MSYQYWCVQLATEVDRAASFERELRKGAALASQMVEVEAENTKLTDLLSALEDELSALRNEAPSGTRPPLFPAVRPSARTVRAFMAAGGRVTARL